MSQKPSKFSLLVPRHRKQIGCIIHLFICLDWKSSNDLNKDRRLRNGTGGALLRSKFGPDFINVVLYPKNVFFISLLSKSKLVSSGIFLPTIKPSCIFLWKGVVFNIFNSTVKKNQLKNSNKFSWHLFFFCILSICPAWCHAAAAMASFNSTCTLSIEIHWNLNSNQHPFYWWWSQIIIRSPLGNSRHLLVEGGSQ